MRLPNHETVAELLGWRPKHGVISVYLDLDPFDRGQGWRIELRNGLDAVTAEGRDSGDRDRRYAVEATVKRIAERWARGRDDGRTAFGFTEVSVEPGREAWFATQLPAPMTTVVHNSHAFIRPLLTMLDDGAPRGVVLLSAERVRLLHWHLGRAEEMHTWDMEMFSLDWRERKSQRAVDPARLRGTTASGRDQYGQRLDANRDRFLRQAGELAANSSGEHGWREVVVFGAEEFLRPFSDGFSPHAGLRHAGEHNLVSEPLGEVTSRLSGLLEKLNRDRERGLVKRARDAAWNEGRAAFGVQETVAALMEGRVEHLLFDAGREFDDGLPPSLSEQATADGLPLAERMIELALETGAEITPVEGEAAGMLEENEGVVALLRY